MAFLWSAAMALQGEMVMEMLQTYTKEKREMDSPGMKPLCFKARARYCKFVAFSETMEFIDSIPSF